MDRYGHLDAAAFADESAAMLDAAQTLMRLTGCDLVAAARQVEMAWKAAAVRRQWHSSVDAELSANVRVNLFAAATATASGFSGLAYSGGVISQNDELFAIDLADIALPPRGQVSLLLNHDPHRIAGRARAEILSGALFVRDGRFTTVTPSGREIAGLHAEGQPLKLSVGVNGRIQRLQRAVPMQLNGRSQMVSAVMRKARLLEVSIVPAGADADASIH